MRDGAAELSTSCDAADTPPAQIPRLGAQSLSPAGIEPDAFIERVLEFLRSEDGHRASAL